MSASPIANRSFLHRNRKASLISDKVVYATLDSLALKRARLPLQLLPVDDIENIENIEKSREEEFEKKRVNSDAVKKENPGSSLLRTCRAISEDGQTKATNPRLPSDLIERDDQSVRESNESTRRGDAAEHLDSLSDASNAVFKSCEDENGDDVKDNDVREVTFESASAESPVYEEQNVVDKDNICETNEDLAKYDSSDDYENLYLSSTGIPPSNDEKSKAQRTKTATASADPEEFPEVFVKKKRPRNFAKNVLHYVPGHLVKRRKKTKKVKKHSLSSSLSSLKALPEASASDAGARRSRSLSREELKCVVISSPSNFVHVASATNLKLIDDENNVRSSLEQVVITHEQKCATLPLLVGRKDTFKDKNGNIEGRRVSDEIPGRMPQVADKTAASNGRESLEADATSRVDKNERTAYAEIKSRFSGGVQLQSAKVLEPGQPVKRDECGSGGPPTSPEAGPRANFSFLWSSQARNFLEDKRSVSSRSSGERSAEETDDEDYDDVGPSNAVEQESTYDDVGLPSAVDAEIDEIYDDVVSPNCNMNLQNPRRESPRNEGSPQCVILRHPELETLEDDQYLSVNNDYSSVEGDDDDTDADADGECDGADEQDVYDDVALPSKERINSLYAGFTGSTNGKESEWEDLEDFTPSEPCPCRRNGVCGKNDGAHNGQGKKKLGQRWTKKTKKQRPRSSRRNSRSSVRTMQESAIYDGGSDDSNYETLYSYQPDDISTNLETCTLGAQNADDKAENRRRDSLEAPTKPVPPHPREASLTQSLGRRMKLLRRTWSITKGSLGRIRRRTSAEEDRLIEDKVATNIEQPIESHETGKYFSFRKHFRKNITGLSTFYLDGNGINNIREPAKNNNNCSNKGETIYGNIDWYNGNNIGRNYQNSSTANNVGVDHYSVLAEQEPLYQFYAAAAARIAFESDSDGYEEVEVPSLSSATDLARPGHRTLWCQTPQVIDSGLLQRLTSDEKKIQEAKFEILTSEASYLNSLRVLESEFLNHESVNEILTPLERDKLFGGVPGILQASYSFLGELETVWRQDLMLQGLPNALLKYAEKCRDIYVAYCSNQVSIDTTLKELRDRKGSKFLETITSIEMLPACQSLTLHSFLMLPMQRVTRLPLLADAVLSKLPAEHADRSTWEEVLTTLSYVAAECNEGARAAAQAAEIEALARKLEYSSKVKPVILRDRYLVRSGMVVQLSTKADMEYKLTFGKRFNKTPLQLFLLTDYLLVTRVKHNTHGETYSVVDTCKRSLVALEAVSEDSPFAGRNAMMLTLLENHCGRQAEYVLTCESKTERERWLEAVSPPKRGLLGETLYETWDCPQVMALYSYSPDQPDELSLQPGDVIKVLRKMADGWYQGEKLLGGEQGWFPGNYTKEVASEHVRARNLKQRHRLLALSGSVLQHRAKLNSTIH